MVGEPPSTSLPTSLFRTLLPGLVHDPSDPTHPPAPPLQRNIVTRSGLSGTSNIPPITTDVLTGGGTGSITGTGRISEHTGAHTGTILSPGMTNAPELTRFRGWKLDRILLVSTLVVVFFAVGALAAVYAWSSAQQTETTSEIFKRRLQAQARELGQTLSHTLSLTTAPSMRDNNLGFLGEVAKSIIEDNANVLRVQFFDSEGLSVADSDPRTPLGTEAGRKVERQYFTSNYQGRPAFEYQEPIDYGSGTGRGLVVLTYSLEPLQLQLQELAETNGRALTTNIQRTLVLGCIFLVVAAIFAAAQSRRITRPLGVLTESVRRLATGDLETRVGEEKRAAVEVKTLGAVFNHMADRISWLLEDVRSKALLEREMLLARTVQETLLPNREPYQLGSLRVAGLVSTAEACGGDWWLRTALGPNRVVLGVGDVTGHGLSTALVATSATSGFAAAMKLRDPEEINAELLITSLNQTLFHVARGEYQMSSALAIFDLGRNEIEYVAGAHPSPILFNRQDGKSQQLLARGALLGQAEQSQYQARRQPLRPGDVVVWYTDGLTESRGNAGKQYGAQRLAQVIKANGHLNAENLRDAIMADVREFCGEKAQDDDLTVVVAEFQPLTRSL